MDTSSIVRTVVQEWMVNNMELIEKEKAIGELMQQADAMKNWSDRYADERKGILTAIRIIEIVPKVDAEPVIRCKDCKHRDWDTIDVPYGQT
jgi:hypothetical protein